MSDYCKACRRECDKDGLEENPYRGGDGHRYCKSCWHEWWILEDDLSDCPIVNRVFPRWCTPTPAAIPILFPRSSGLLCAGRECTHMVEANDIQAAVDAFFKYGFVVLKGALAPDAVKEVKYACQNLHSSARALDPEGLGNRGRGRFSFSGVTGSEACDHITAFTEHLLDNEAVLDVLDAIFEDSSARGHCCRRRSRTFKFKDTSSLYHLVGTGGDFCEGYVREFQQLHSDYSQARPLRGPCKNDSAPIHDKLSPPLVCVNFNVQELHRWNGAMRLIPWDDMASFVNEEARHWGHGQRDVERPPHLGNELKHREDWLSYRLFPLSQGDALIRDVRVWHGGCPNLSRAPRYLPAVMAASSALVKHFRGTWPSRSLPLPLAQKLSKRPRNLCRLITAQPGDSVNNRIDDFAWTQSCVGLPAWRDVCLPGAHLGPNESEALSLCACLEQLIRGSDMECLESNDWPSREQLQWLASKLEVMTKGVARRAPCKKGLAQNCTTKQFAISFLQALARGFFGQKIAEVCNGSSIEVLRTPEIDSIENAYEVANNLLEQLKRSLSPDCCEGETDSGLRKRF